ncbi:MAG: hypothetical protein KDI32_03250, partial [Pseudomonadales bacterium]|nr:hypothetical protein [Pseudomonadales bacterium]
MSRFLFQILVMLLIASAALAQSRTPLTIEATWRMQRLGDPSLSPDGRVAVVPVSTADMTENKILTDLW